MLNCEVNCLACFLSMNNSITCSDAVIGAVVTLTQDIVLCSPLCADCLTGNTSICTRCYPGYSLFQRNCVACADSRCFNCSISPSICLACVTGYTVSSGSCSACASYCLSCQTSGPGNCDENSCDLGYELVESSCLKCSKGCTSCSPHNLQSCSSCGIGFFMLNNSCIACSIGCISCLSSNFCNQCLSSYILLSGSCIARLPFPCLSQNISGCLSCAASYFLSNFSCIPNLACNSARSCQTCPLSRFLYQNLCLGCPSIGNCMQCFSNGVGCAKCNDGYYSNGNTCLSCSTGCKECTSPFFCITAAQGFFTLAYRNSNSGKTSSCSSYCLTCAVTTSRCTSCPSNYTQIGYSCISTQRTDLKLVFNPAIADWSDSLSSDEKNALLI